MSSYQELITSLRHKGLRVTPQREMILMAFSEGHSHMSAEQILEKVHQHSPTVNIATIYRNLDMLRGSGLLTVTVLPGRPLEWELVDSDPHHHLVCNQCHSVQQIPDEIVKDLSARLLEKHGFHADLKHLALSGICSNCAETMKVELKDEIRS